jgi:energy-converting hydrogenase Eha subunit F
MFPREKQYAGEILSYVLGSTDRIRVLPSQVTVVIEAGPGGMMHAMLFHAAGAEVVLAYVSNE